jgi:hypothetical protein
MRISSNSSEILGYTERWEQPMILKSGFRTFLRRSFFICEEQTMWSFHFLITALTVDARRTISPLRSPFRPVRMATSGQTSALRSAFLCDKSSASAGEATERRDSF